MMFSERHDDMTREVTAAIDLGASMASQISTLKIDLFYVLLGGKESVQYYGPIVLQSNWQGPRQGPRHGIGILHLK